MKEMQNNPHNRIMIAAPHSGSGKTLITCGLLQALLDSGKSVAAFKCGPDYIDPLFHERVLGVPSKNLDLYFTDEKTTRGLFLAENESQISVVEGVMGLYDGLGGIEERASAYHLAKVLQTPIILVIDVHGMGRSVLAEVKGFLAMDTGHLIQGLILNRCSVNFYEQLKGMIEKEVGLAVLGYFPVRKDLQFQSRHLGLQLPDEIRDLQEVLERIADQMKETIDLETLLGIAGQAADLEGEKIGHICMGGQDTAIPKVKIGVARDAAFCFYYADNLRLLEAAGAELCYFSPMDDGHLPKGIQGLLLGGGYPELYAKELSENLSMRQDLRQAVAQGMPILAECGGFMYLHKTLGTKEGERYKMVGVVDGDCHYTGHLVRFGYVGITEKETNFLSEADQIRGHEFHYYDSSDNGRDCIAKKPVGGRSWECVHENQKQFLGFAHLYYPSNPVFVQHFIEECRREKAWQEY